MISFEKHLPDSNTTITAQILVVDLYFQKQKPLIAEFGLRCHKNTEYIGRNFLIQIQLNQIGSILGA